MAELYVNAAFRPKVLPTDPAEYQAAKQRAVESAAALKMA